VLAVFGELHPAVLREMDVAGPVVGFEVLLEHVPEPKGKGFTRPALDVSQLQAVARDFAFVVAADVPAEQLTRAAAGAERSLISAVEVFDLFQGASLGEGMKSVAISVHLQPRERTMTDDEIDAVAAKIVAAVEKTTGGKLRG
jgi:phenylalanyl-tRNA synthetase beta chain